ncbi:MAG: GGDEF domain-containing protein [Spirochaetales bacterium]|nr:GGDEF domain-containing protein [Spirochaetales bacterium]
MENLYKVFFEMASQAGLIYEKNYIKNANQEFLSRFGYEKEKLLNSEIDDVVFLVLGEKEIYLSDTAFPSEINGESLCLFMKKDESQSEGRVFFDDKSNRGLILWGGENVSIPELSTDALTGLPSRIQMESEISKSLHRRYSEGRDFCLLLIDINKLKFFNGNYGRSAGDRILKNVAARLRTAIRDGDVVGRWKDDDFLVILNNFNREVREEVLKRIDYSVHNGLSADFSDFSVSVEVNLGLALPDDGDSVDSLEKKFLDSLKKFKK